MTNHTPGPWTRGYGNYVYAGKNPCAALTALTLIATCMPLNGKKKELEVAFANARLIAAAPELLTALEGLYQQVIREKGTWGTTMVEAERAICKARGEE